MRYKIDHDFHIHSFISRCSLDPEQTSERILRYAEENGYQKEEILYVGDDFGDGGGDSHVRLGGMDYVNVTDYRDLEKLMRPYF